MFQIYVATATYMANSHVWMVTINGIQTEPNIDDLNVIKILKHSINYLKK